MITFYNSFGTVENDGPRWDLDKEFLKWGGSIESWTGIMVLYFLLKRKVKLNDYWKRVEKDTSRV